jgi:polysaccharide export outer membrane protein
MAPNLPRQKMSGNGLGRGNDCAVSSRAFEDVMPNAQTCIVVLRVSLLALAVCLSGCGGGKVVEPASSSQIAQMKASAMSAPSLRPGEKLRIVVDGESGLSGDYQIDPSGYLSMPVVGIMEVVGMTPGALRTALVSALKAKSFKAPGVTVSIIQFIPFYILGEVMKPGNYDYVAGLNALSAIAIAGGQTFRADESKIYIQHLGEDAMHSYELTWPIPISPGDVIEVPRRTI